MKPKSRYVRRKDRPWWLRLSKQKWTGVSCEQGLYELLGVEGLDVVELLSDADELDRRAVWAGMWAAELPGSVAAGGQFGAGIADGAQQDLSLVVRDAGAVRRDACEAAIVGGLAQVHEKVEVAR